MNTDFSLRQLISTGKIANVNSYETLMEASFGRPGFIFLSTNMFLMSYGAMVAFLMMIKDILPILFHTNPHNILSKRVLMFAVSFIVVLPLSMQRDMADFEKFSRLNVLLNICLVLLVVSFSPVQSAIEAQGGIFNVLYNENVFDLRTFFVGFGVCSFTFVCQDTSFIIAGSFSNPTKSRWKTVTNAAMFTCCSMELFMGICGYLAYQENTSGNVLNNMNAHHWSGMVSRAILVICMFFAYPLNAFMARHVCVVLLFEGQSAHDGDDSMILSRRDRRIILTLALYVITVVPALFAENIGKVLSITGTIAGSSLSYIGPGSSFIAVHGCEFIDLVHGRWKQSSCRGLLGYPSVAEIEKDQGVAEEGGVGLCVETVSTSYLSPRLKTPSVIDFIGWYILGMPLWCLIAQIGRIKLSEHWEKESVISPGVARSKRVTVVTPCYPPLLSYSAVARSQSSYSEQKGLLRSPSDSVITRGVSKSSDVDNCESSSSTQLLVKSGKGIKPVAPLSISTSYGATSLVVGNKGVAKVIASEKNRQNYNRLVNQTSSLTALDVENELSNDSVGWFQFLVAIGYMILGVFALLFGLVSIFA